MEYNPENVEDNKQVVSRDEQGAPIVRQGLVGGGTVVERDPEAQASDYQPQPQATVVTATTTRQTVRPSPTHGNVPSKQQTTTATSNRRESQGGFWSVFTTKTTGRYFFPLHMAIAFFSFLVLVSGSLIETNNPNALPNNSNTGGVGSGANGEGQFNPNDPAIGGQGQTGVGAANTATQFIQYGILVAQLSFAVSIGSCVMERLGLLENVHIRVALSAFQVFFWGPALVLLTFFSAFVSPLISPNGFFGVWFALIASAIVFAHETERSRPFDARMTAAPRTSLFVLFFTSLMIMGSGIVVYNFTPSGNNGGNNGNTNGSIFASLYPFNYVVLAISVGAITAFLCVLLLVLIDVVEPPVMLGLGTFVWLWVAATVLVLTFKAPFDTALGNGYYSCLFSLLASFGLILSLRRTDRSSDNTQTGYRAPASHFYLMMRAMTFSSLVVLVAASLLCRNSGGCNGSIQRYQIAAGAVPLGLGLIVLILEFVADLPAVAKLVISLLMLAWWIAAFIVLTFFGDFWSPVSTGASFYANGFFFTWAASVFAVLGFAEALKEMARESDPPSPVIAKSGFLFLIICGSLAELGAGIAYYYNQNNPGNLTRYAIALGAASIGLVLILFFILLCLRDNYEAHDGLYNLGLYLLTIWWAVGALVLTYDNLWTSAIDNGYFSIFFTLGTCFVALSGAWRTEEDDNHDDYTNATSTQPRGTTTGGNVNNPTTNNTGTNVARY